MVTAQDVAAPVRTHRPVPPARPRGRWPVAVAVVAAALLGFGAGYAPAVTLLVGGGLLLGGVLLVRLEWAALAVVAASVFEDYLAVVDPRLTKALAVVLVAAWLLRRAQGRLRPLGAAATHSHGRSGVVGATLLLAAVLLASTLVHANATGGGALLRWAGFIVVLLVLVDSLRGSLAPDRVARTYVLACTAAATCGVAAYLLGHDRRVGGPVGDPNDFAVFLLAALPLALALRSTARRPRAYDVAVVLLVAALLGTLSRGALVGLVVLLVVAVLTRQLAARAVLALAVVTVTTVALALSIFPQLVEVSLEQKEHVAEQNVAERLELWESASRMTLDAPVLGHGPGSFVVDHRAYLDRLPISTERDLDVAHNTYLETAAELGVLGLAALLSLLAAGYLAARSGHAARGDRLAGAVAVALVGTAVAAVFVTGQYSLPLWLLCALGAGLARERVVAS